MDIRKIEAVVNRRICPKCELGMVRETEDRVYQCDHSQCGEVYDFSLLPEKMINMLLDQEQDANDLQTPQASEMK